MSREAWGDPPDSPPQHCPMCGESHHTPGCEVCDLDKRRIAAEAEVFRLRAALSTPSPVAPEPMTERDQIDLSRWHAKLGELADAYYEAGRTDPARRRARADLMMHALDCATGWRARSVLAAQSTPTEPVAPGGVPSGWALVPVEATEEMLTAAYCQNGIDREMAADAWCAMVDYVIESGRRTTPADEHTFSRSSDGPGAVEQPASALVANCAEQTEPRCSPDSNCGISPPPQPKLIGWRTSDFLYETADREKARNWEGHRDVLPIFEGDPHTKLVASEAPREVVLPELCERICAAIKAADDKSTEEAGYMLDSNDCITIVRDQFDAYGKQCAEAASSTTAGEQKP